MRKVANKGKSMGQYGQYLIKNNHGLFFTELQVRSATEVAVVDPSKSKLTTNAAINTHSQDHYQVLDVSPSASFEEIKAAYKKLVLQYHPDKNKSTEAAAKFLEITAAFEVLGDADMRLHYDLQKHLPRSVRSRTKAVCFSGVYSTSAAQEDNQLLNASRLLLLLLLVFNNPSLLHGVSDDLRKLSECVNRAHMNLKAHAVNWTVNRMLISSLILVLQSTLASAQNDVFLKDLEQREGKPDNFSLALNEMINRVTSFPCMTTEWLYGLTEECPASFLNLNASQTDFFVSTEDRVTLNIKKRLGIDGARLIQKLLTAGAKLEKVRFYNNVGIMSGVDPISAILLPRSSIADLSSFQESLKGISNCGRTFPMVVEGEWLKIDCVAFSAPGLPVNVVKL